MMTSMGGNRARGNWEQTQSQTQSQTQHKQRPQVPAPHGTDDLHQVSEQYVFRYADYIFNTRHNTWNFLI